MKKRVLGYISMFIVLITLTGCFNTTTNGGNTIKCQLTDCINKISPTNTYEEINDIIGIDGELTSESNSYKIYKWQLTDTQSLEMAYYNNSSNGTITIKYNKKDLDNNKVDFSNVNDIKEIITSEKTLTYNELVSKLGGVEGILEEKSQTTKKYIWINSNGDYLNANFPVSQDKCSMISGTVIKK